MPAKVITAVGNAQISTAQSKFGGASGLFDGTGDYLTTPDHADFYHASANFTYDMWIRLASLATDQTLFLAHTGDGENYFLITALTTGEIRLTMKEGGVNRIGANTASAGITTGAWFHVALVRNGTDFRIYVGGVSKLSTAYAGTMPNTTSVFSIAQGSVDHGYSDVNGYVDEFRVSINARWTAGFTPETSAYTTDANTVLLLHMDGANGSTVFTDSSVASSSKGKIITLGE